MIKLAALGPAGTFSELAVNKYKEQIDEDTVVKFYPTITKVVNAVGNECSMGIVPIENTLDGFVQVTLDLLASSDLNILNELVIPIQFAFVANSDMDKLQKIYAQFKTQGQCCKFLENLDGVKIITTESNGVSVENIKKEVYGEGAIIPRHMLTSIKNPIHTINCVTDSKENETRFIVLSKDKTNYKEEKKYKTSIVIMDAKDDKPGSLSKVLNEFASKGINLTSIISRPTKRGLGKYYFFIDIDGCYPEQENVREVIEKIRENSIVKIIGSYYSL
ncbi:prephenate dehydratase [Clostridium hydrogenum]|uniref:prephenate dehydratase n=1 Tax=Clostridium hydrogenum TaxID=2855764 RepID=UPI001F3B9ED5|nr:prephenate dehydratase domain-containing protein [Clostridium hydrogenum]